MNKIVLALLIALSAPAARADPATDAYRIVRVDGSTVRLGPAIGADPALRKTTLEVLHAHLATIRARVTPAQMAFFRTVPFWIEKSEHPAGATFHRSREWLQQNQQNPDKAGGIEIVNAAHFCLWATTDQPMMILHELSHAYHMRVLGEGYAPIEAAYRNALDRHLYESVAYVHGGQRRAYALTDSREFFAELTEAYFGRNDFFPYDKRDLRTYDPVGFALMESVWGKTPG